MAEGEQLLQRVRKVRVSDTVVEQIKAIIGSGTLEVGDQLPSERELIDQLQLSRASVREALRILEHEGLIEVRPGKGTFIVSDVGQNADEVAVRRWFRDHSTEVLDTLEVREALESRAARLATVRARPEHIEALQANVDKTGRSIANGELDALVHLDRNFHRLIAVASGIELLSELVDFAVDAMGSPRRSLLRLPGNSQNSLSDHQRILDAIAAGEPDVAEKALLAHTMRVRRLIIEMMEDNDA